MAGIVIVLLQYPRIFTQIFFGEVSDSFNMVVHDSYPPRETDEKTIAIVAASKAFIDSLDIKQAQTVMYAFKDNEQRVNWSNLPESMIPRGGLKLGQLNQEQRGLLDTLLGEILSEKGAQNIDYQLAAEDTLKYKTDHFYVAILGEPSTSLPWMFQFGGHHLAINVTIYGSDAAFSPMLTGGRPLHIRHNGREIFITEEETAAAQAFLDSLTEEQEKIAVQSMETIDLMLGPGKYGTVVAPEGIKGSELTDAQKDLLLTVIKSRLDFINDDDNAAIMTTVKTELEDTYFGWWGRKNKLGFAYFRITAPSMVLEYSPQDNSNASATDHVHNMYRNPKNDYGSAWLEVERAD